MTGGTLGLFVLGLALLVGGAKALVRGASRLAGSAGQVSGRRLYFVQSPTRLPLSFIVSCFPSTPSLIRPS